MAAKDYYPKGYKKGKVLTLGELKNTPEGTPIHLKYRDEDGNLRINCAIYFIGYKGQEDEIHINAGWSIPIDKNDINDNTLLENLDNSDWTFTVSEAIKK